MLNFKNFRREIVIGLGFDFVICDISMLVVQAVNNSKTEHHATLAGIEDYEFNFWQSWTVIAKFILNADLLIQGGVFLIKKYI